MRLGSMFAGIGGICLGFKKAGADLVWANENDQYACSTYRHNFGSNFLVEGDICKIDPATIPDIDILAAGFPCQPFSIMGKQQGFADPRGTMYFEILRVIDAKRPQTVFLENVKNLVRHDNGRTIRTIYQTLAERGYSYKHCVLGAHTHANIPQYRDRIFIVAFLDEDKLSKFTFPDEMQLTKNINNIVDRSLAVDKSFYYDVSYKYYKELDAQMTDNNAIYRIDDSGVAKKAWRICPTLKANMGTYYNRVPLLRDNYGIRKLTPVDCLAFQGFPKKYDFPDIHVKEVYKQLGNTVCLPVVFRIARRLMSVL